MVTTSLKPNDIQNNNNIQIQNNGFVQQTSLRSLICFVIRGELQPTRLQLGSCSFPPLSSSYSSFSLHTQSLSGTTKLQLLVLSAWSFRLWTGLKRWHTMKQAHAECPLLTLLWPVCLCDQIEPYLPYEFTCEGMLQRVNAFIENQVLPPYLSPLHEVSWVIQGPEIHLNTQVNPVNTQMMGLDRAGTSWEGFICLLNL